MCGRYVLSNPSQIIDEALERLDGFELTGPSPRESLENLAPSFNVAPTQTMPILHGEDLELEERSPVKERTVRVGLAQWNFASSKAGPKGSKPLINARSETLLEKRSFTESFQRRRCLVPASGFFEWRPGGNRQPFYFYPGSGSGLCFAGLWKAFDGNRNRPNSSNAESATLQYCIVTGPAGQAMSEIHHRRPIILDGDGRRRWLAAESSSEDLLSLLSASDPPLELHPVSFDVNKVRIDEPALIEPVREAPSNLSLF